MLAGGPLPQVLRFVCAAIWGFEATWWIHATWTSQSSVVESLMRCALCPVVGVWLRPRWGLAPLQERLNEAVVALVKSVVFAIVRNPLQAWRVARRLSTWARRVLWALPIVSTLNKFKGMVEKFRDTCRAAVSRALSRRAARAFRSAVYDDAARAAAVRIQSRFRAHKAVQARVLATFLKRRDAAVVVIQSAWRAARVRRQRRDEPEKFPRLLIRPDSTFMVLWSGLFLALVSVELAMLLVNERAGLKASTPDTVKRIVLGDAKACLDPPKPRRFFWRAPQPVDTCTGLETRIATANRLATAITWLTATSAALDVPVKFFAGRVNNLGVLVPPSFVQRWIVPGLLLQIIINPSQKPIYVKLKAVFAWINDDITRAFALARICLALSAYRCVVASSLSRFVRSSAIFRRRNFFVGSQSLVS